MSSSLTFFYKYIFTILWNILFGVGSIMLLIDNHEKKWLVLLAWIIGATFMYLFLGKIKKVELDGEQLFVSNYLKSETIQLSNITSITRSFVMRPELVSIKLEDTSTFGNKITFMPKLRLLTFKEHPCITELQMACDKAEK